MTTETNETDPRARTEDETAQPPPHERDWPRPWMPEFLRLLGLVPEVSSAYRGAGVSKATVYRWKEASADFSAAWDEAIQLQRDGFQRLVYNWITVGLPVEETREDVEYDEDGKVKRRRVWTTRKAVRSERLAEVWLRAWYPDRYKPVARTEVTGGDGPPVVVESIESIDRQIAELAATLNERARRSGEPVPDEASS